MPLPKNLSSYAHVRQILDAALSHNRVTYTLPTPGAATRWRQEAYYFRRLIQAQGNTTYDNFLLKVDGAKVIIEKRVVAGTLTTDDGKQVTPANAILNTDPSEAERFAFEFAKKLGLEVDGG